MASFFNSGSVLFLLFVVLFAATQATPVDNLLPVCKTVGGGSKYVGIQFCLDTLHSDPRSANGGNYQELAVVTVDLLTANATRTKAKIDGLLGDGDRKTEDATRRSLRSCLALFDGILQSQAGCAAAVKDGKFSEATSSLEKSAAAAKECQGGFSKSNVASPVTVENDNAFQLAKLAVALIRVTS
ncbi:putative invertase inhibitor [Triticum dicoccoides]|uniref:putative invertase inhibitor n=1 Tax=Triticum dicoccoides TaxID=85692 RepID=UPI00188FDD20|nr:putative invertase inhibitor [Triticum dicoccoides]